MKKADRSVSKVSVIVPSYNMGMYIRDAIDSVLEQKYPNVEVLVVDDGSTDNTRDIVGEYQDPSVHYIHQENAGLSAARNTGMQNARGKYLVFLDSDDALCPGSIFLLVDVLEANPLVSMVAGNSMRTDEEWHIYYKFERPAGVVRPTQLFVENLFPVNAAMLRKSSADQVGKFDESLKGGEDWDFFCRLMLEGGIIYYLPRYTCFYRFFPDSMSANPERQTNALLQVIEKTFNHDNMPIALQSMRPIAEARAMLSGATKAYQAEMGELGKDFLELAIDKNPLLVDKNCRMLLRHFLYASRVIPNPKKRKYFRRILRNLPPSARRLRAHWRKIPFLLEKESVNLLIDRREYGKVLKESLRLAVRYPGKTIQHFGSRFGGREV